MLSKFEGLFLWFLLSLHFALPFYFRDTSAYFCSLFYETQDCRSNIKLYVNQLNSDQSLIPYEYYDFDFCLDNKSESSDENLGQSLFGDRIRSSSYEISFLKEESCKLLCEKEYNKDNEFKLKQLKNGMLLNYYHHWIINNMPVMFCFNNFRRETVCTTDFPMGCYVTKYGKPQGACVLDAHYSNLDSYYIFNHVDLVIEYQDLSIDPHFLGEKFSGQIVGINVKPRNIGHKSKADLNCAPDAPPLPIGYKTDATIIYTYSLKFRKANIRQSSMWDYILEWTPPSDIQLFNIVVWLVISFILTRAIVVNVRTIRHDITLFNNQMNMKESQHGFGWKVLQGDVFRPPRHVMLLSTFIGSGSQLFCTTTLTLILSCFGLLSPPNRGALMICALLLWAVFGLVAGYVSARIFKSNNWLFISYRFLNVFTFGRGRCWKTNILMTCFLCPGFVFSIFFVCNLIYWIKGSSAAVPFMTMITVLALWLVVSTPLTFVGAFFGQKNNPIELPTEVSQMPRQIPRSRLYKKSVPVAMIDGFLPFFCACCQLSSILKSIWAYHIYYTFGYLFFTFIILIVLCSEIAILRCYSILRAENYQWWWRCFYSSGFASVYLFVYCTHFFGAKLTLLYVAFTIVIAFIFLLLIECIMSSTREPNECIDEFSSTINSSL